MPVFEREVYVDAPLKEVWTFHSNEKGLVALTPAWMGLRVEETVGPDGEPDPEILEAGATVISSVRPFGVGPKQRWVSKIVARDEDDDEAVFRDVMEEGPFPRWIHTHTFEAVGRQTRVHDRVEYDLPLGPLREVLGPLGRLGLEPMFRYRHRKTKQLLE